MLDEKTRNVLEDTVGMNWREDQGVEGRSCIMQIIKEDWKNIKPSVLRYYRELRRELKEGWIQSLRKCYAAQFRIFRIDETDQK